MPFSAHQYVNRDFYPRSNPAFKMRMLCIRFFPVSASRTQMTSGSNIFIAFDEACWPLGRAQSTRSESLA